MSSEDLEYKTSPRAEVIKKNLGQAMAAVFDLGRLGEKGADLDVIDGLEQGCRHGAPALALLRRLERLLMVGTSTEAEGRTVVVALDAIQTFFAEVKLRNLKS